MLEILSEFKEPNQLHLYANEYGTIYGFLDAFLDEGEISITNLYVDEKFRRLGIATLLLDELGDTVILKGIPAGINFTYPKTENLAILDAFMSDRYDFFFEEDSYEYVVPPSVWQENQLVKSLAAKKESGLALGKLTNALTKALIDFFREYELDVIPREGTITDYYDTELSLASIEEGQVKAAMLVRLLKEEKTLEISALACQKDSKLALFGLGSGLFKKLFAEYKDYNLRFAAVNEASETLTNELFKGGLKRELIRTAVWMEI